MTDEQDPNEELKVKMRAALDKKRSRESGVAGDGGHTKGKAPETHGPLGGVHMHRRKAGGGGS